LKEAFAHIDEAMTKINTLKAEALKQAKEEVAVMKDISNKLESKINEVQNIEKITAVKVPSIEI